MEATRSNLRQRSNMKDERKTKHQLISELDALRRQLDSPPSTVAMFDRTPAGPEPSDDRFEILFNQSQDALMVVDARNGSIIDVNQAVWKILGYAKTDLIGKKLKDLFKLGSGQDIARLKRQLQIHGTVFNRIYPHPDGTDRFLDLTAAIIPWETGQAILATARDVTERKADEDRLAELFKQVQKSHDDFQSIFNMLNLGIVALDEEGLIRFINQAAFNLSGKRKISGKKWNRALPFQKADIPAIEEMLRKPASKRRKIEAKFEISGGKRYWLEVEIKDDPRDPDKKIMALYDMSEVYDLRYLLEKSAKFQDIIGKSEPMQAVYARINEVSSVDWTVLIQGETGTGKELVARAIHATSHRKGKPFIAVNCAGLEDSLLTSQLFGHRRGAFTGAVEDHKGFFEAAAAGTLFLDEIGDISKSMQASLLRVLEEKEITRVGESRPRKVDVRILAATHRNLSEAAESGEFRRDLLYRIRVARIALPPLRERREDIPLLYETFLARGRAVTGKNVQRLSDDARRLLLKYHWPGNVRELKSVVESAVLGCKGAVIHRQDLPFELVNAEALYEAPDLSYSDDKDGMLAALAKTRGSRTKAARLLGMSRATFYRRLDEYRIKPSN
jgi:PAS domain S-box-containing protein